MAKPKILQAVRELDRKGFYNGTSYLGDIRVDSKCLDSTTSNGIYTFTGGKESPSDRENGPFDWSLVVRSCGEYKSIEQIAERLYSDDIRVIYVRYLKNDGTWTEFKEDLQYPVVIKEW